MTTDDLKELFTRLECAALQGLLASNPGGSMHKQPNEWTDHAVRVALAGIKSHYEGLAKLDAMPPVTATPVGIYQPPAPYAPPPPAVVRLQAPPAPAQAAPALGVPAAGSGSSPDARTNKFVNAEMCPICAGPRAAPTQNNDPQCPFFHFQPYGNVIAPTPPPAPPQGPPGPPTAPNTGVPPLGG